jgi:hypothetical protein
MECSVYTPATFLPGNFCFTRQVQGKTTVKKHAMAAVLVRLTANQPFCLCSLPGY